MSSDGLLLSQRAYAAHRKALELKGGTHRAVQVAIDRGRLRESVRVVDGRKVIDPVLADQEWTKNTDTLRSVGAGDPTTGRPLGDLDNAPRTDARESDDVGVAGQARAAQAVRLTFQAKLSELEYRKQAGELVIAADVVIAQTRAARSVRDRVRSIPDRLSATLAAETDPHRCRMILVGEIDQALGDIGRALREEAAKAAQA